jgi:hypothetical protein
MQTLSPRSALLELIRQPLSSNPSPPSAVLLDSEKAPALVLPALVRIFTDGGRDPPAPTSAPTPLGPRPKAREDLTQRVGGQDPPAPTPGSNPSASTPLALRLKAGEALTQCLARCGDAAPKYAPLVVQAFVRGASTRVGSKVSRG